MTYRLWHGDCLQVMPLLPPASVDLILCDLPYNTTQNKWDRVLPLDALWREYRRIARGAIVLTAQTPFDKVLGVSNLAQLRYEWVWEKTNATGHLNATKAPMKAHENVLVFYDKPPTYNPQKTWGPRRKVVKNGKANHGTNYGGQSTPRPDYDSEERFPRSVQVFASDNFKGKAHPTQKPVALMEYLVRTYTNPGDIVLDNCMGSGTTGEACANTGRIFFGIEQDEGYFTHARERIAKAYAQ